MLDYKKFRKATLLAVIVTFAVGAFLISFSLFMVFFGQEAKKKELTDLIQRAHKISTLHEFKFERALSLVSSDTHYGIFDQNCNPVYVNDLLLNTNACVSKNHHYLWNKIPLGDKKFTLAQKKPSTANFIRENSRLLQVITLAFLVSFTVLCFISFKLFITIPSKVINSELDNLLVDTKDKDSYFPESEQFVFSDLYRGINKLIKKVTTLREQSVKYELSVQVAHDLRSPMALLQDQIKNPSGINREISSLAIKRIFQISESLISNNSKKETVNLDQIFRELVILAQTYGINLKLPETKNLFIISLFSDQELYRIFTNLIKNSKEANASEVTINLNDTEKNLINFEILDNGSGASQETLGIIRKKRFSNKNNGNGLGLSYIRETVQKNGGKIEFDNGTHGGFRITISLPIIICLSNITRIVFVDDDKYIRRSWEIKAKAKDIDFIPFCSVDEVMNAISTLSTSDYFFIDFNIGSDSGVELAEKLNHLGFTNLYLATGYESSAIVPNYIIDIFGKEFPFS